MSRLSRLTAEVQLDLFSDAPERWLPVPGWPGYEVSDWGQVRSFLIRGARGKGGTNEVPKLQIIGGYVTRQGYRMVCLNGHHGKSRKFKSIHSLVLEAFVGPCPPGTEACHNDGNPGNNRLENLRWDTRSSNQVDSIRHGTHAFLKLAEVDIPVIWERLRSGETATEIAREYGVGRNTISVIRNGARWSYITRNLPGWPLMPVDRNEKPPIYIANEFTDTAEEIWLPIPGWIAYRVSNMGRIQSCWGKIKGGGRQFYVTGEWRDITPTRSNTGYLLFQATGEDKHVKWLSVHACVLEAFACPRPLGMIGCHNNSKRDDNRASNLRWDTHAANARDRVEHSTANA